jgi:hypothetical protein
LQKRLFLSQFLDNAIVIVKIINDHFRESQTASSKEVLYEQFSQVPAYLHQYQFNDLDEHLFSTQTIAKVKSATLLEWEEPASLPLYLGV